MAVPCWTRPPFCVSLQWLLLPLHRYLRGHLVFPIMFLCLSTIILSAIVAG